MTPRYLINSIRLVVNNSAPVRDTLLHWNEKINNEITLKRKSSDSREERGGSMKGNGPAGKAPVKRRYLPAYLSPISGGWCASIASCRMC